MLALLPALIFSAALAAAAPSRSSGPVPALLRRDDAVVATWYSVEDPSQNEGEAPGTVACEGKHNDGEKFVAVSKDDWRGCGSWVWIWDAATQKLEWAEVVDQCGSCDKGAIDLSPALMDSLHGNRDDGVITVNWGWA